MIILNDVTIGGGAYSDFPRILTQASLVLPSDRRIALLGPSDAAKQMFIKVLAGVVMPTQGQVVRKAAVSFPVGQLPGFSRNLTIRVNVAHVARLYGADVRRTLAIVEGSLRLRRILDKPYDRLPQEFRRPLAEVLAFAIPFDVYLLTHDRFRPGKKSKGERDLTSECHAFFAARTRTSGMIIPTNNRAFVREHCDMAICLDSNRLEIVDPTTYSARRTPRRRLAARR